MLDVGQGSIPIRLALRAVLGAVARQVEDGQRAVQTRGVVPAISAASARRAVRQVLAEIGLGHVVPTSNTEARLRDAAVTIERELRSVPVVSEGLLWPGLVRALGEQLAP